MTRDKTNVRTRTPATHAASLPVWDSTTRYPLGQKREPSAIEKIGLEAMRDQSIAQLKSAMQSTEQRQRKR